jgi:hypothetical protein
MILNQVYVLDTNVFIESAKRYYAFDIAPGFWDALVNNAKNGKLLSIDRVRSELVSNEIRYWAEQNFHLWFKSSDQPEVIEAYREGINFANNRNYTDGAKSEFASIADSWLIAFSYANDYTLVTEEKYDPNKLSKILIPNVCRELDIHHIDTFQMLRELHVKWT